MGYWNKNKYILFKNQMKIYILTSKTNWINSHLDEIISKLKKNKMIIKKIYDYNQIKKADLLLILGYHKIIPTKFLNIVNCPLVVHESNLPQGRGWSPLTWDIINNKNKVFFSLIKADEKVDSGSIFFQTAVKLKGNELYKEIRQIQLKQTIKLCKKFIDKYPKIINKSKKQIGKITYYRKRNSNDSYVSVKNKISDIFNLLRVSDYKKYPVHFIFKGRKFKIKIENHD